MELIHNKLSALSFFIVEGATDPLPVRTPVRAPVFPTPITPPAIISLASSVKTPAPETQTIEELEPDIHAPVSAPSAPVSTPQGVLDLKRQQSLDLVRLRATAMYREFGQEDSLIFNGRSATIDERKASLRGDLAIGSLYY